MDNRREKENHAARDIGIEGKRKLEPCGRDTKTAGRLNFLNNENF